MRKKSLKVGLLAVAVGAASMLMAPTPAWAATQACAPKDDVYTITGVATSSRPTNLYSAYITGPGSITYDKNTTSTASASYSPSVGGTINAVIASFNVGHSIDLAVSKSWTGGFSYTLNVPAGQTRRMRLYQESRAFHVTRKFFDVGACNYKTSYSSKPVDAPRKGRVDHWKLEA